MLYAIEPFFFDGRDEASVFYDRGGCITVICVYPENEQWVLLVNCDAPN